jgi:hypothetical protein
MTDLPLTLIKDGGAQIRADGLNQETVHEYAEAMRGGDIFPPIIIFFDGTDHWLAEGFHRVEAHGSLRCGESTSTQPGRISGAFIISWSQALIACPPGATIKTLRTVGSFWPPQAGTLAISI